jgi:hypothetical protein
MKKFLLLASTSLLLFFIFNSPLEASAKKKKKKIKKVNSTVVKTKEVKHDSIIVHRAPGVKNKKELDSIKNSRVKQPY